MPPRTELQTILENILGSKAVYFQPPTGFRMIYPCIVYERSNAVTRHANNNPYSYEKQYKITVIDKDPDSLIPDLVSALPKCIFDRSFKTDNLNHDVFDIFF